MRHNLTRFISLLLLSLGLLWLAGCIRTDVVPDPKPALRPARVVITPTDTSLPLGAIITLHSTYFNTDGKLTDATAVWRSGSPGVASIDNQGRVQTVTVGQTRITAAVQDSVIGTALITVVDNPNSVARVVVQASSLEWVVGRTTQLTATAYNLAGTVISGLPIQWESSKPDVASVSSTGALNALIPGNTQITATVAGVVSSSLNLTVVAASRTAQIVAGPNAGETATGTATLVTLANGQLELQLDANFRSTNGPSLYVYLANCSILSSSNGSSCGRVELAKLQSVSGAQTYAVPVGTGINDYSYILIQCKPFVVTFGTGQFN